MTDRARLGDLTWNTILAFLLAQPDVRVGDRQKCRRFVSGVLWIARTGAQWRELPGRYGKWNSVYKRFSRWSQRNIGLRLMEAVGDSQDLENLILDSTIVRAHPCAAGAKGGKKMKPSDALKEDLAVKSRLSVDGLGNPLNFSLTGGQTHDITQAQALLRDYSGEQVLADKAYDSSELLKWIDNMNALAVIPPRRNRKQQREYDLDIYKERHLVECFFNKLKDYRRVFSRFEKRARNYLSFVHFLCGSHLASMKCQQNLAPV